MLYPLIMAGGSGSRLWPVSRHLYPKQFLTLRGDSTMLQETARRLNGLVVAPIQLICNEDHRFLAAEQLRQIGEEDVNILLEPMGRNTAPAIALAALKRSSECKTAMMLVLPADHVIDDITAFHNSVKTAQHLAEAGMLVTFGVVPTHAEVGYGYIEKGSPHHGGFTVERFIEKPDRSSAIAYLESGKFLWNSGMFMFRADRYLEELGKYRPDILDACRRALESSKDDMHFTRIDYDEFAACPAESVDYAVMEKTADAVVVPLDAGWSDIGSWSALWSVSEKSSEGNVCQGDVICHDTSGSYIRSESRLVVTIGVENLVIIETKDAILVSKQDSVQAIKEVVRELENAGRSEHMENRVVYRPWGFYDSIDVGDRYQVKRISVKPKAKLSLQMHHHRAEHWVVVKGTAKVTNGDKTYLVTENQSTYIPVGQVHTLENPGVMPLELIEVQSGAYLGEDDIVRFEDKYGRS